MATNRHAQIRYTILDRCFSNFNRLYVYEALLKEVNTVLYDIGSDGIKLRQLQYDIDHMKSDEGWAIELDETLKVGRKKAFRYVEKNFSIANHPLNVNDVEQLETTIAILSRYKHREEFSWLEEFIPRMVLSFDLVDQGENGIISYQENFYLKGKEFIGILFNLILKKKKVKLIYEPYGKPKQEANVNPYHLKQYNNRWFLLCYNEEYQSISNYSLDRINHVEELEESFEPNTIDWVDYFHDIIGVTKPENGVVEEVVLKFSENRINYVLTKPLHGSQRPFRTDESGNSILIEVIPNRELYQLILSFGSDLEVLQPQGVKDNLKTIVRKMNEKY